MHIFAIVKFAVIIWTFYFLALAGLPCADAPISKSKHFVAQLNQVSCHGTHHESGHKHSVCSPLCVCSCCGAHINPQNVFRPLLACIMLPVKQCETIYKDAAPIQLSSDFFHPPQS